MKRLREMRKLGGEGIPSTPTQLHELNESNANQEQVIINDQTNVLNASQEHTPILTPPRIIHRKPNYINDIDENTFKSIPD